MLQTNFCCCNCTFSVDLCWLLTLFYWFQRGKTAATLTGTRPTLRAPRCWPRRTTGGGENPEKQWRSGLSSPPYTGARAMTSQLSTMLRTRNSPLLWIQSLPYWPPGPTEKELLSDDSIFSRQLRNLTCRNLIGWWGTISRLECIHRTTLNCNTTPNISDGLGSENGSCTAVCAVYMNILLYDRCRPCDDREDCEGFKSRCKIFLIYDS